MEQTCWLKVRFYFSSKLPSNKTISGSPLQEQHNSNVIYLISILLLPSPVLISLHVFHTQENTLR